MEYICQQNIFQSLHGVDTVFSKAASRSILPWYNIQDTYGGINMQQHDVALSRRFITRPGSLQVIRYAFEMAKKNGRAGLPVDIKRIS